jgi:hypothetical protein
MLSGLEVENEVATSDRGDKWQWKSDANSAGKDEQHEGEQTDHDEEHKAGRREGRGFWAGTTKNLKAASETGDGGDTVAKDQDDTGDELDRPAVGDSPRRAGSESPETDPDFTQSSSESADTEWIFGSGMAGLKVSDSLVLVESKGVKSVSGDFSGEDGEALDTTKAVKKLAGSEESFRKRVEVVEDVGDESKDNDTNNDINQRRRDGRNVGLAASATAVMLAAIWMMERMDMA